MSIHFKCQCGKGFKVDESFGGKRTKCPSCGVVVTIPKADAASTPPPAAKQQFQLAEEAPKPPPPPPPADDALSLEDDGPPVGGHASKTTPAAAPPPPPPPPRPAPPPPRPTPQPPRPAPPPPPPPPPATSDAVELGLEVETMGTGGKIEAAPPPTPPPPPAASAAPAEPVAAEPALDLSIEVETLGPGGKTGSQPVAKAPEAVKPPDSTKDEIPIELPTDAPPAAPAPAAAAPALAPEPAKAAPAQPAAQPTAGAAPAEKKCPKCGVAAVGNAVICLECGTPLSGPAPAKPASPKDKALALVAKQMELVKKHKIPAIAAGVVVLLGLGAGGFFLFRKKPAPPPPPPAAAAPTTVPQTQAAAAPATTTTTLPPKWERKFNDETLNARRDLEDYRRAWSAAAGKPVDAGQVPASVQTVAALPGVTRFRPVAHAPAGPRYSQVLFSDGGIRLMLEADRPLLEVRPTPAGPLTTADSTLLRRLGPQLQVVNSRLASVDISIDGKPAGQAAPGADLCVDLTPGAHDVVLSLGGTQTPPFKINAVAGVGEILFLARQQDLPYLPIKNYRTALTAAPAAATGGPGAAAPAATAAYSPEKTGNTVTGVKSAAERVILTTTGPRAIAADGRSIDARIEREEGTIEGLDGKTLYLSDVGRVEEGIVKYKSGVQITFRRTPLGPVGQLSNPDLDLVGFGQMRSASPQIAAGPAGLMPGQPGPRDVPQDRGLPHPPGAPPTPPSASFSFSSAGAPEVIARAATTRSEKLAAEITPYLPNPDMDAIGKPLKDSTAVSLILARLGKSIPKAAAVPAGAPPVPVAPATDPARPGSGRAGPAGVPPVDPRRPGILSGAQAVGLLPTPPDAQMRDLPNEKALAALAVYNDSTALAPVMALVEGMDAKAPGYADGLLAVARCGRVSAVRPIRAAVEKSRIPAAIAFSMIDDPTARQALPTVVAGWTAKDVAEAAAAWPGIGGPACRRALAESILTANPTLMEDPEALTTLTSFEPCALEQALLARVVVTPKAPEPATAEKDKAPAPPKDAPPPPPPQPAEKPADTTSDLAAGAPYSWLALARLHNTEAIAWYVGLLKDKDPLKRRAALEALAEVPDTGLVDITVPLLKDADLNVRCAAALFLVRVANPPAVKALTEGMTKDLALRSICDAAPVLARKAGAQATGDLLIKMLSLMAVGTAKPADPNAPPAPAPAPQPGATTTTAKTDAATPADILAAVAAAHIPVQGALLDAIKKLSSAADPAVRSAALARVLAANPADAAALIEAGLKDAAATVRVTALWGIRRLPAAARAVPLKVAVKDAEVSIRAETMYVAADGADPAAVKEVISAGLADAAPAVVTAAARAAARRGDPALGETACAVLSKQTAPTPETIPTILALIDAAAALRSANAAGALMLLLANSDAEIRAAAAAGLGRLRSPSAGAALASALQDKDPAVSAAALTALGEIDPAQAAQAALAALQSKDLPIPMRRKILLGALARSTKTGADTSWIERTTFGDADLAIFTEASAGAPKEWTPLLVTVARRALAEPKPESRRLAADMLANLADDPDARKLLMDSWEKDASNLGMAVAAGLRRSREPLSLETDIIRRYRQLSEPVRWPGIAKGTPEETQAVRLALIDAAGRAGGEESARALRNMISPDAAPDVVTRVVNALVETNSPVGVQYLSDLAAPQSIARADGLTPFIIEAITRAGQTQRDKALEVLARLTRSHMPADVTAGATDAMARLGALPATK